MTEVRRIGMCQSLHSQMKGCRNHFLDLQLSPCLPCYCCLLAYWLFVDQWIKSRDWKEVTHWRRGRKTDTEKVIQGQHHADLRQDTFPNVPTTRSLTDDPVAWPRDARNGESTFGGLQHTNQARCHNRGRQQARQISRLTCRSPIHSLKWGGSELPKWEFYAG